MIAGVPDWFFTHQRAARLVNEMPPSRHHGFIRI